MNHKFAYTALSLALVLGGATGALAASHKHNGAQAYAAASGGTVTDPRQNKGGNHETWCDMNAQCNGWNQWLSDVNAGKLKAQ
ncbi:MAG TPA: hypothetical protein VG291_07760 [Xanthobacteraceae bacterium]|jgi:hypothetical protein|nr:hypothetical protein [Xanthobacteraceae bacterium]